MLNSTCNDGICCYLLRCRDGMGVRGGAATRQFAPMGAAGQLSPPQASPSSRRPVNLLPWRVIKKLRRRPCGWREKSRRENSQGSTEQPAAEHAARCRSVSGAPRDKAIERGILYNKMGNVAVPSLTSVGRLCRSSRPPRQPLSPE